MATQIAPTPVVKGTAAVKIYKEANQKRSQASKNGAEKGTEALTGYGRLPAQ